MKKKINARKVIQIFFFVLVGLIATNHQLSEQGITIPFIPTVSLHAICPFGGVETFLSVVTMGTYIKKIHESAMVMMGIVIVLTLLLGPVFCSFVCPLGTIQEWFGKLGKKIMGKKYNKLIPQRVDKYLRYIRYISLVLVVYLSTKSLSLVFLAVDPFHALYTFWTSEVAIGGVIVLIATLVGSLFVERPWCKYACPYGALLGIFNLFRIFKIKRNPSSCISCGKCNRACPMNIKVQDKTVVRDHQCISCLECTSTDGTCPVENTVLLTAKGGEKHEA